MLAVDDDPQDLRYVRDVLSGAGYAPITTADPGDALRLVEEERPTSCCSTSCCRGATASS